MTGSQQSISRMMSFRRALRLVSRTKHKTAFINIFAAVTKLTKSKQGKIHTENHTDVESLIKC